MLLQHKWPETALGTWLLPIILVDQLSVGWNQTKENSMSEIFAHHKVLPHEVPRTVTSLECTHESRVIL